MKTSIQPTMSPFLNLMNTWIISEAHYKEAFPRKLNTHDHSFVVKFGNPYHRIKYEIKGGRKQTLTNAK